MNILIAEDAPIIQMAHAAAMEKWGFEYDMVSNGAEAIDYARANNGRYDLCIMDVSTGGRWTRSDKNHKKGSQLCAHLGIFY